jgi:hypothetical protein
MANPKISRKWDLADGFPRAETNEDERATGCVGRKNGKVHTACNRVCTKYQRVPNSEIPGRSLDRRKFCHNLCDSGSTEFLQCLPFSPIYISRSDSILSFWDIQKIMRM